MSDVSSELDVIDIAKKFEGRIFEEEEEEKKQEQDDLALTRNYNSFYFDDFLEKTNYN